MTNTVASFTAVQVSNDRHYPIWTVDYTATRGETKRSQVKFNTRASAERHGAQLVGLVVR
jgi:hypothetical protein